MGTAMNYLKLSIISVGLLGSVILGLGAPTITAAPMPPGPVAADLPSQEELEGLNKGFLQLYAAGDYVAALDQAEKYEQAVKAALGTSNPTYAAALRHLALASESLGKYPAAEDFHARALALYEQKLGTTHPIVSTSLTGLATIYVQARAGDQRESSWREAR
jgi:tetratricopeptide (TPR) repeat protein